MTEPRPRTQRALVIQVWLMEGRFHGEPEWPPAPARLYQALLAAAAAGEKVDDAAAEALRWLERQPPPTIAAPVARSGQEVKLFVPNNDLDEKGGDPAHIADIRVAKRVRPRIFDARTPLIYVWPHDEDGDAHAEKLEEISLHLNQLGRGVDMAWAKAERMPLSDARALMASYLGQIYEPTPGAGGPLRLPCPAQGSYDSLTRRHEATIRRFSTRRQGRKAVQIFQQPPKARFVEIAYDSPPHRALFELRPDGEMARFAATALTRVAHLTETLRDLAAHRLTEALPDRAAEIERAIIGRKRGDGPRLAIEARVRLVPLPSIGNENVDPGIRRVVVEVPGSSPLRPDDVFWAFSDLRLEWSGAEISLVRSSDTRMFEWYEGLRGGSEQWRTITPAALPAQAARRRIDPDRIEAERKDAEERLAEEARAQRAVLTALRHAGVRVPVAYVGVQREPFSRRGERAEAFADGTRFDKHALWHVEVVFRRPVKGPLVLGDGRFLGLGLMRPLRSSAQILAFRVTEGLAAGARAEDVAAALRRAVLARVQQRMGKRGLPPFISGHDAGGRPNTAGHLYFGFDPVGCGLFVAAPWLMERHRGAKLRRSSGRSHWESVQSAMVGFHELRAGSAGLLKIEADPTQAGLGALLAPSRLWISRTPYVVDRHHPSADAHQALAEDVRASCRRMGLAQPRVEVVEAQGVPGVGLAGMLRLEFPHAVAGPLMLGRTRHLGGGLFASDPGGAASFGIPS